MDANQLDQYLERCRQQVNRRLEHWLQQQNGIAPRLAEAMRYATLNGGKRVRPVLAYAAAAAVGGDPVRADDVAAALEMVHSYSLVHDDLPAMDNDALRRGQPTCHIAFDEATAILAGDALQCLAFEVIARSPVSMADGTRLQLIRLLAGNSGTRGMAGGQALDLEAEGAALNLQQLELIHQHKTGCLIRASVAMGALTHPQVSARQLEALDRYAQAVGLAFQVQDDILDVVGETAQLGKHQGADRALKKVTYPDLLGLDQARDFARELSNQAVAALADFGAQAEPLRALATYIVVRTH